MKYLLRFLINIGKLNEMPRRDWVINQIKNPESISEHIFRTAIIAWVFGSIRKFDTEKLIKMALIHDLAEVYARDITPYDLVLTKNKKKLSQLMQTWPRFSQQEKKKFHIKKFKKEIKGFKKIISLLPEELKKEMKSLWFDYKKGLTKEGRFVKQADKLMNFLQGMEYWKKYKKINYKLWLRWINEIIDKPIFLQFLKQVRRDILKENV